MKSKIFISILIVTCLAFPGQGLTKHAEIKIRQQTSSLPQVIIEFAKVSAGYSHTCTLTGGGGVKCWGENRSGQLGDGTTTQRSTPVDVVSFGSGVVEISAGGGHTCLLTSGGGVKCWGGNYSGQLGDGTTENRTTPVDVVGLGSGVVMVVAGLNHTCALTSRGGVKCWGSNDNGQLGDGTTENRTTPINVVGLGSGVALVSAGGQHTCTLTSRGRVKCWGANWYGQIGDSTTANRSTPVNVVSLGSGVTAVTPGGGHTCAVTSGGGVKCWGSNYAGQLGDGTTENRTMPVDVVGLGVSVSTIIAGYDHTCALTIDGGIKCWGNNGYGQLGDGTTENHNLPVDVIDVSGGVITISTGGSHTCALVAVDRGPVGRAWCWGWDGYGQLGLGTTTKHIIPVDVFGLSNNLLVMTGGTSGHSCAITADGGVKCWGNNVFGKL